MSYILTLMSHIVKTLKVKYSLQLQQIEAGCAIPFMQITVKSQIDSIHLSML